MQPTDHTPANDDTAEQEQRPKLGKYLLTYRGFPRTTSRDADKTRQTVTGVIAPLFFTFAAVVGFTPVYALMNILERWKWF